MVAACVARRRPRREMAKIRQQLRAMGPNDFLIIPKPDGYTNRLWSSRVRKDVCRWVRSGYILGRYTARRYKDFFGQESILITKIC